TRVRDVADVSELVYRAQQGDSGAMRELITSQQRYVYSIARGIMRSEADAADMTQEALLRLFRSLGSYRGDTKFTTWLYRLASNICLDELRRRGLPHRSLDLTGDGGFELDPADPDPWSQPERWLNASETAAEL